MLNTPGAAVGYGALVLDIDGQTFKVDIEVNF
jgi:hypothetical protein